MCGHSVHSHMTVYNVFPPSHLYCTSSALIAITRFLLFHFRLPNFRAVGLCTSLIRDHLSIKFQLGLDAASGLISMRRLSLCPSFKSLEWTPTSLPVGKGSHYITILYRSIRLSRSCQFIECQSVKIGLMGLAWQAMELRRPRGSGPYDHERLFIEDVSI
jgi:hypothetical protein